MKGPAVKTLLIEDNSADVVLLQMALEADEINHFEVSRVERLSEGIALLAKRKFDIVLLDLGLPDTVGVETFQKFREKAPDIPVIVVSGFADDEAAMYAVRNGAQDYLVKGNVSAEMVARSIRYALEREVIQDSLRQSEERFRTTFDEMLEGAQIIDFDWRYVYLNPAAERHNRRPNSELLGNRYMDMWPGIETTEVFRLLSRCMTERVSARMENRFQFPDGGLGWFELSIQPIPEGIFILSNDVTERRRAELERQTTQARLASALESMSDAVFITDLDGRLVESNEAYALFHRFNSKTECPVSMDAYSSMLEIRDAEGTLTPMEQWPVPKALRGEAGSNEEYSIRRRDTGETWIGSYSYGPIREKGGSIIGSVVSARDITEQRRKDEALRNSELRYKALVETTFDWIWEVDVDAKYTYASPKIFDLLGYTTEEIIGRTPFEFMPIEEAERVSRVFAVMVAERRPFAALENTNRHKDGHLVILESSGVPVFGPTGEFKGYRGMGRDITARKQAQEELRYQNVLLSTQQEASMDGILVIDAENQVHSFNKRFAEMWGVSSRAPAHRRRCRGPEFSAG
jgi:PAS domain S-box-containing protein